MPFLLNTETGQVRCTYCGRVISGQPIVVKTYCINRPWVFCSEECYNRFLRQWLRNQEAHRSKGVLRKDIL